MFNELAGSSADIDFLVGRLDFTDKLKLISNASLIIAGDTSTLHIGAFLGRKVIGLYGPTDKNRYGPVGQNVYVISSNGCSGCQNLYGDEKCTMDKPDCMESIPVETVLHKIDDKTLVEYVVDAVKGAGESIMANYDRELFKNYHLFFLLGFY